MATILICDDNETVHQTLGVYLKKAGFDILSAFDGAKALEFVQHKAVDLIILDIMMPEVSGIEVCRRIRKTSEIPIIILSAKIDESDRISGLELGADDYVTKPFSPKEVVARIKTVLRRSQPNKEAKVLKVGRLMIDMKRYDVFVGDARIKMTPKEVDLLAFLISHAGEVVSREEILNAVWGYDYYGDVRTVDTLIARIRRNVREYEAHVTFRSIYGVGYMIEESHE